MLPGLRPKANHVVELQRSLQSKEREGEGSREYEKATVYLTYQKRKGLMEELYKNKPGLLHVSHYATVPCALQKFTENSCHAYFSSHHACVACVGVS